MNTSKQTNPTADKHKKTRAKPGSTGKGEYFRIEVRPKSQFTSFRYHDIGDKGHIQRLAGKRSSGSWATQTWLISKHDAHLSYGQLIPDTQEVKELLATLGSRPKHLKADIFTAKDRPNIPERDKPTKKQILAQQVNIKKAQTARWHHI